MSFGNISVFNQLPEHLQKGTVKLGPGTRVYWYKIPYEVKSTYFNIINEISPGIGAEITIILGSTKLGHYLYHNNRELKEILLILKLHYPELAEVGAFDEDKYFRIE